uniref:Uncharacterized protein n=1 Tax=Anguilla anguilla TaxID=7936 RepID=A0A0E9XH12_ANGAN
MYYTASLHAKQLSMGVYKALQNYYCILKPVLWYATQILVLLHCVAIVFRENTCTLCNTLRGRCNFYFDFNASVRDL